MRRVDRLSGEKEQALRRMDAVALTAGTCRWVLLEMALEDRAGEQRMPGAEAEVCRCCDVCRGEAVALRRAPQRHRRSAGGSVRRGTGRSKYPCPRCDFATALKDGRYGVYRKCTQDGCGWKREANAEEFAEHRYGADGVAAQLRMRLWQGSLVKRRRQS